MITVNGKQYARNDAEFTNSVFNLGGSCVGFYKTNKGGVVLMDMQKEPFAFIVSNKHNEQFFVSCVKQENGKIRYFYALTDKDKKTLGLDSVSYSEERKLAKNAAIEAGK